MLELLLFILEVKFYKYSIWYLIMLERLMLEGCTSLVDVYQSVGYLNI